MCWLIGVTVFLLRFREKKMDLSFFCVFKNKGWICLSFSVFKYKGYFCLSFWLLKIIAKGLLTAGRLVLCLIMASGRTNQPPVYTLNNYISFNNNFCFTKLLEIKWHASLYYVIQFVKLK